MALLTKFHQLLAPVRIQGEVIAGNKMLITAMAALVKKYGVKGKLSISQLEAAASLTGHEQIEISFNFDTQALEITVF